MGRPVNFLHCALIAIIVCGCEVYHKKPLTEEAVQKALAPLTAEELKVRASEIRHPLLKPLILEESKGLSPEQAGVIAVLVNPGLRAVRDQRGIAQAELLQAKLLPNPDLSATFELPTGGTLLGTVNAWGLDLNINLSALISYSAQKQSAESRVAQVDLDVAWQEWQIAEAAKTAVYRMVSLNRQTGLAKQIHERLSENADLVRAAADSGLMTGKDLADAVSARDQALSTLTDLSEQAERQRLDLNYLLGQPPERQVKIREDIEPPNRFEPPAEQALLDGLPQRRLDLLALQKGYESQEASLRAAILQQFPRTSIGLVEARDTGNVITTGIGVSVSIPIFDRNQAQIALQKATRQELFDEYVDRVATARSDIAKLCKGILLLNEEIKENQESLPDLQKLFENYREAAGKGDADALSYYEAWNNYSEKRMEILALQQELIEARIGLELASGRYQIGSGEE